MKIFIILQISGRKASNILKISRNRAFVKHNNTEAVLLLLFYTFLPFMPSINIAEMIGKTARNHLSTISPPLSLIEGFYLYKKNGIILTRELLTIKTGQDNNAGANL